MKSHSEQSALAFEGVENVRVLSRVENIQTQFGRIQRGRGKGFGRYIHRIVYALCINDSRTIEVVGVKHSIRLPLQMGFLLVEIHFRVSSCNTRV